MSNFLMLASLALVFSSSALAAVFLYPVSKKLALMLFAYVVETGSRRMFAIMKFYKKFRVCGENPFKRTMPAQFLVVTNHQSLLDIMLFVVFFSNKDVRFVAKEELGRNVPLISMMLKLHEHCLIPRKGSAMETMQILADFGKHCAEKNIIPVIFPEGTRSRDGELGSFFSAGFRALSMSAKLPIVVCALDGGFKISTLSGILRNIKNGSYHIKVLKIYEAPESKKDCLKILDESHELIKEQLTEWRKTDVETRTQAQNNFRHST